MRPWLILGLLAVTFWTGCVHKVKVPPPPPAVEINPVEGVWQTVTRTGKTMKMIFEPGGRLTFEGGLEFYSPGTWDFDPMRHRLVLTLPKAEGSKLQIFQMSLHDGVQSFDPVRKQITYHFDNHTDTLNIAGWPYTKTEAHAAPAVAPEPVLK
jgi:hypothetical protein